MHRAVAACQSTAALPGGPDTVSPEELTLGTRATSCSGVSNLDKQLRVTRRRKDEPLPHTPVQACVSPGEKPQRFPAPLTTLPSSLQPAV